MASHTVISVSETLERPISYLDYTRKLSGLSPIGEPGALEQGKGTTIPHPEGYKYPWNSPVTGYVQGAST